MLPLGNMPRSHEEFRRKPGHRSDGGASAGSLLRCPEVNRWGNADIYNGQGGGSTLQPPGHRPRGPEGSLCSCPASALASSSTPSAGKYSLCRAWSKLTISPSIPSQQCWGSCPLGRDSACRASPVVAAVEGSGTPGSFVDTACSEPTSPGC